MKNNRFVLFILSFLLFAGSVFCQQNVSGKVVEIIDGKTVVIQISTGKLTAVLQYIEIPEPEQPLSQAVKNHLKELVLDKNIDFRASGIAPNKTLGQIYLNGVDIGQQLVRDGAAWHISSTKTGQSLDDSDQYEGVQALAKSERRGIWSIRDIKPPWEFRAEKEENQRRAEEAKWQRASITSRSESRPGTTDRVLPNSTGGFNNAGALINRYDPKTKTGSLETPMLGIQDSSNLGRKMACNFGYYYREDKAGNRKGSFVLYMAWIDTPRVSTTTDLVMKVDGHSVGTTHGKKATQKAGTSVVETLAFELTRAQVEKIANGSDVGLWLGNEVMIPAPGFQMLLYNLLDASK
jgi:micrococcal nuclease